MKVRVKSYDSYLYCEVFLITERRDGKIYKTKRIGFCKADRPKKENEVYSALSTSLTKQSEFELELID